MTLVVVSCPRDFWEAKVGGLTFQKLVGQYYLFLDRYFDQEFPRVNGHNFDLQWTLDETKAGNCFHIAQPSFLSCFWCHSLSTDGQRPLVRLIPSVWRWASPVALAALLEAHLKSWYGCFRGITFRRLGQGYTRIPPKVQLKKKKGFWMAEPTKMKYYFWSTPTFSHCPD